MKYIKILCILLISSLQLTAQSIVRATIGTSTGRLYGGNLMLNYTIGESFVGNYTAGSLKIQTGFWAIVPTTYTPLSAIVYRFTGNGKFSNNSNWLGNMMPPNPLPSGSEIVIEPIVGGQCLLDSIYSILPNSRFVVKAGSQFIIQGSLRLQ